VRTLGKRRKGGRQELSNETLLKSSNIGQEKRKMEEKSPKGGKRGNRKKE